MTLSDNSGKSSKTAFLLKPVPTCRYIKIHYRLKGHETIPLQNVIQKLNKTEKFFFFLATRHR